MKLDEPFYKFPFRFDARRMAQEISAIPEEAWCRHPSDLKGNSFLPLVATKGELFDEFDPPMQPTRFLEQAPYLRQILAEFRTLIGRTRLMRLEPGHGVPLHVDTQQYWRRHTRVHVPIVTDPAIRFQCGDADVHMAAGEAWTFDNWRRHRVVNETATRRIHLTMDTYGSTEFWNLAKPHNAMPGPVAAPLHFIPFRPGVPVELLYESHVGDPVMSPAEVDMELGDLVADAQRFSGNDPAALAQLVQFTTNLVREWRTIWHLKGPTQGLAHFAALANWAMTNAALLPTSLKTASNDMVLGPALGETLKAMVKDRPATQKRPFAGGEPRVDRPVFIVAAPRSGSTWLYEMLAQNPVFETLGGEGHEHVEVIAALQPGARNFDSNRLEAVDAAPDTAAQLRANYLMTMRDVRGQLLHSRDPMPRAVRFLEKTPKNALRIPFLKRIFPDARFIFLHRAPGPNISAIMEAWRSGRFVTYPDLAGWQGLPWSLLLISGWRALSGMPLEQIAMHQWRDTNRTVLDDLAALPRRDWVAVSYEALKDDPQTVLRGLCAFAEVPFGDAMRAACAGNARVSASAITPPDPQKWRKNAAEIESVMGEAASVSQALAQLPPMAVAPEPIAESAAESARG